MKTLFALLLLVTATAHATDIKISIDKIKAEKGGVVQVALYADNGTFMKGTPVATRTLSLKEAASFTIPRMNPGRYALAIIHDKNKDGKLNKAILGWPTEGYTFSNFTNPPMPPKFDSAAFNATGAVTSVQLHMYYFPL